MKKLLLTSDGLTSTNIRNKFFELIDKKASDIKLLFIPTAAKETEYIEYSKQQIISAGIDENNLYEYNLDYDIKVSDLLTYDVIWVNGGNTFYLLQKINESGFKDKVKHVIENGVLYVGVSAGSIVASPNIESAGIQDPNEISMTDFTGMNFTDKVVVPHIDEEMSKKVQAYKQNSSDKIIELHNGTALLVLDEKCQLI